MRTLLQDVRYGLRNVARTPGFALVAMLTLALGIGANTTIFSVINHTLLKPLAFPSPERLVLVWQTFGGKGPDNWNIVSGPNFWDFQRQSKSFASMAIFDSGGRGYNLGAAGAKEAEQVSGLRVSAGFFDVLGVKPMMGRTFLPEEETLGRDREVILTYGLWKTRFAGDPAIVGKQIRMDGADFQVVGVMPREFQWQFWSPLRKLFVPVGYTKTDFGRRDMSFVAIARLKPGVSVAQASAEVDAIGQGLAKAYPEPNAKMGGEVSPLGDFNMEGIRATMTALLAAVAFVLLIACVNVANLLLARGAARQKEFAVRRALGASGWRLGRQLMTESMLLAAAGGALGLLLAAAGTRALFTVFQLDALGLPMRPIDSIQMDGRVYAFALAVSLVTGVLFGVAPAWSVLRGRMNEPLKEGGRGSSGRSRLRHVLVAAEVALALVVLTGAGLMIRSMTRLLSVDPGLNPKNVLALDLSVPQEIIYNGPPDLPRFCQDVEERLGAVPGVLSVGAVSQLPMQGEAGRGFQIEGRTPADPGSMPHASYSVACPNYFRSMGIPVRLGREFTFQDSLHAPQAIVINEALAQKYWPHEDPVGKAILLGGRASERLTIVGVVGDVHFRGLDQAALPQFMRPYAQAGWPVMNVVVRTAGAPLSFVPAVKKALAEALPDRPARGFQDMEEVVKGSTGDRRLPMLLLSAFSALALALAAIGIVGVVSHSVAQRTREIGIRMALGAGAFDVLRMIVTGSMAWIAAGLLAGLAGAAAVTRMLTGMLYQVKPLDPVVLGAVSAVLLLTGLAASYFPARRAAKIDPAIALRCE